MTSGYNLYRFLYRLLGAVWIAIGSLISLLPVVFSIGLIPSSLNVALGLFCLVIGLGLLNLNDWAYIIGAAFNFATGVCLLAFLALFYVRLSVLGPLMPGMPKLVTLAGGSASLLLMALGFQLNTPIATRAFFGFPARDNYD